MVRTGRTAALQRCSRRPAPCRTRLPHRHDRQMVPAATGAGTDSQRPLPRRDPHLQPAARGRRAESRLLPRAGDALRPGGAALLGDRCARFGGGAFRQDRRPVGTQTPPAGGNPPIRPRRSRSAGAHRSRPLQGRELSAAGRVVCPPEERFAGAGTIRRGLPHRFDERRRTGHVQRILQRTARLRLLAQLHAAALRER